MSFNKPVILDLSIEGAKKKEELAEEAKVNNSKTQPAVNIKQAALINKDKIKEKQRGDAKKK